MDSIQSLASLVLCSLFIVLVWAAVLAGLARYTISRVVESRALLRQDRADQARYEMDPPYLAAVGGTGRSNGGRRIDVGTDERG